MAKSLEEGPRRKEFEGHQSVEADLPGSVDDAHAAMTDFLEQLVVAEASGGCWPIGFGSEGAGRFQGEGQFAARTREAVVGERGAAAREGGDGVHKMIERGEEEGAEAAALWVGEFDGVSGEQFGEETLGQVAGVVGVVTSTADMSVDGKPAGYAELREGVAGIECGCTAGGENDAPMGGGEG